MKLLPFYYLRPGATDAPLVENDIPRLDCRNELPHIASERIAVPVQDAGTGHVTGKEQHLFTSPIDLAMPKSAQFCCVIRSCGNDFRINFNLIEMSSRHKLQHGSRREAGILATGRRKQINQRLKMTNTCYDIYPVAWLCSPNQSRKLVRRQINGMQRESCHIIFNQRKESVGAVNRPLNLSLLPVF